MIAYARRMDGMKASEIRELLKLVDRADVISFAGGIPDPALFPAEAARDAFARRARPPGSGAAIWRERGLRAVARVDRR